MADLTGMLQAAAGAATGDTFWISSITATDGRGDSIATNSSGDIFLGGSLNSGSGNRPYTAKYNNKGVLQSDQYVISNQGSDFIKIQVDGSGNIFAIVASDLLKLNSSYAFQWQKRARSSANVVSFKVKPNGNIIETENEGGNLWLVEWNTSGTLVNINDYAVSGSPYVNQSRYDLDVTPNGTIVTSGSGTLSSGASQGLALSFSSTGSSQSGSRGYLITNWQHNMYAAAASRVNDVWYAAGIEQNTSSPFDFKQYIVKMNTTCGAFWTTPLRNAAYPNQTIANPFNAVVDSSDNVYICGRMRDSISGTERTVAWIVKLNSGGTLLWQRSFGCVGRDFLCGTKGAIALTPDENIVFSGYVSGQSRIVVAQLSADGSGIGSYTVNGHTYVYQAAPLVSTTLSASNLTQSMTKQSNPSSVTTGTPTLVQVSQSYATIQVA